MAADTPGAPTGKTPAPTAIPSTDLADGTLTPILERFEQQLARIFGSSVTVWLLFGSVLLLILSPLVVFWRGSDEIAKNWAETVKNVAGAAGILLAAFAAIKWLNERRDRATDVLLALEEKFKLGGIPKGKELIEDEKTEDIQTAGNGKLERCDELDAVLRFYVLLYGVYRARQVPEASLSICFRYWLAYYFHEDRSTFRQYIDDYYPTLSAWLNRDWLDGERFFRPRDFFQADEIASKYSTPAAKAARLR